MTEIFFIRPPVPQERWIYETFCVAVWQSGAACGIGTRRRMVRRSRLLDVAFFHVDVDIICLRAYCDVVEYPDNIGGEVDAADY